MASSTYKSTGVRTTRFAEALELTGEEPGSEYRSDLIVHWSTYSKRWRWCRDIGMSLEEAIDSHKKIGDEIRVVEDQVGKFKRKRVKGSSSPRGDSPPPRPVLTREDDSESTSGRQDPDGAETQTLQEEPDSQTEEERLAEVETPAPGPEATPARTDGPQPSTERKPPSRRQILLDWSNWFNDAITARFALTTLFMLGPLAFTLVFEGTTFLPRGFLLTTGAFGLGTLVAYLTRGLRAGEPKTRR